MIKHRLMRDVAAEVIEDLSVSQDVKVLKILWVNQLGTFDHPSPFPMGSSKQLAIETISIPTATFESDWIEVK
jgi:hypothetical protein